MKMAGLIDSPSRGLFRITDRGLEVISQNPQKVNLKFLRQFPEYNEARTRKKQDKNDDVELEETTEQTPEESMEAAHKRINNDLEIEILDNIKGCTPGFFERLVVELIVKMGYGDRDRTRAGRWAKVQTGGIDGIIKEDKLGLDNVYIQAKRWGEYRRQTRNPEVRRRPAGASGAQGHIHNNLIFHQRRPGICLWDRQQNRADRRRGPRGTHDRSQCGRVHGRFL